MFSSLQEKFLSDFDVTRYRSKYFDIVAEAIRQEVSVLQGEEKFCKVFKKKMMSEHD